GVVQLVLNWRQNVLRRLLRRLVTPLHAQLMTGRMDKDMVSSGCEASRQIRLQKKLTVEK
ncbi:TPA: hypothetical protein HNJ18_26625, partial [Escherichia coli]|nr:hypothetical protein [Escherichia coli]